MNIVVQSAQVIVFVPPILPYITNILYLYSLVVVYE